MRKASLSNALLIGVLLVAGQSLLLAHSAEHSLAADQEPCSQCLAANHLQSGIFTPALQIAAYPLIYRIPLAPAVIPLDRIVAARARGPPDLPN